MTQDVTSGPKLVRAAQETAVDRRRGVAMGQANVAWIGAAHPLAHHRVEHGRQRVRPAGPSSPVVIDPLVGFGQPAVSGVSTDRLWELSDAGESIAEIADGYDLSEEEVRAAVAYEEQFRSLAA